MAEPSTSPIVNFFGGMVAMAIIGLLWFISWSLVFAKIPPENATNLAQIIGMIGIQVGIFVGWYFRGSQQETQQTKTINTLANTAAAVQAASGPAPDRIVDVQPGEVLGVASPPTKEPKK